MLPDKMKRVRFPIGMGEFFSVLPIRGKLSALLSGRGIPNIDVPASHQPQKQGPT